MERDEGLRAACFLALDALRAQHGDELPYAGGLDAGFVYDGHRIPFLLTAKGIYRSARQRGRAALSLQTSSKNPYGDTETDAGFEYAYRARSVDQVAAVRNGLAFCAIHHRAFDQDLVGVSPDYQVRVASTAALIELPRSTASRPDRELLAERFARFSAA